MSQAVDLDHPRALDFLREDVTHVNAFFRRAGIAVLTTRQLFEFVVDPLINQHNLSEALQSLQQLATRYVHGHLCCNISNGDDNRGSAVMSMSLFVIEHHILCILLQEAVGLHSQTNNFVPSSAMIHVCTQMCSCACGYINYTAGQTCLHPFCSLPMTTRTSVASSGQHISQCGSGKQQKVAMCFTGKDCKLVQTRSKS